MQHSYLLELLYYTVENVSTLKYLNSTFHLLTALIFPFFRSLGSSNSIFLSSSELQFFSHQLIGVGKSLDLHSLFDGRSLHKVLANVTALWHLQAFQIYFISFIWMFLVQGLVWCKVPCYGHKWKICFPIFLSKSNIRYLFIIC